MNLKAPTAAPQAIRRCLLSAAAVLMATVLAAFADATPAHAGTYTIWACKPPGKVAHSSAPFQQYLAGWTASATDRCMTSGHFNIKASASVPYDTKVGFEAMAPSEFSIQRLTAWGSAALGPGGNKASFGIQSLETLYSWEYNDSPPLTEVDFSATPRTFDLGSGTSGVRLYLNCHNWVNGPQHCAGEPSITLTGVELLVSESTLPAITNDGGSLVSNTSHSGTERIYYTASDADSGVAKVEVLVDDAVVATRNYTTTPSCGYETWQACEPNQADALDVDTTRLANGQHSVALRVTDAAGNRKATTSPLNIQVANPGPVTPPGGGAGGAGGANGADGANGAGGATGANGSAGALGAGLRPNGQNASASAALQAQFVTNKGRKIRVRYGRTVPITGRLVSPNGRPVSRAKLDVLRRVQIPGSSMGKVGEVVTDSRGRFTYEAPIGPSRLIRFAYRAFLDNVDYSQTSDVELQVTASARLGVSKRTVRNGSAVTFRGTLLGAPAGARKVVELQAKVGRKWRTFETARTRRGGRYAVRYRFTRTTSARVYTFRTRIRTETGFPYLTGYSNRVNVKVKP